jgi:aryl-alcohol dehydrogenase-like predicted oxidoreductase
MTEIRSIRADGNPVLGMGCWAIGGPFWAGSQSLGWGEVEDDESIAAIKRAYELGVRLFDTADVYGAGHSERVLGRALSGHRDEVLIATKWGNVFDEDTRQIRGTDVTPTYMLRALDASLRRLGTDYVDLYQLHIGDASTDRMAELTTALEETIAAGKIRAYAWSTDDPGLPDAMAGPNFAAVQHELNVLDDAAEMLALIARRDWVSVNRGPLAMGLLSEKYTARTRLSADDVRGDEPEWMKYFRAGAPAQEWLTKRDAVRDLLTTDGRTLVQGALAWIWARSPRTIPIPGFRTVAQVEENVRALEHGPLDEPAMGQIERILRPRL